MNTVMRTTTPEPFVLHRQIGSTAYRVRLHFNTDAKETLDDKVLRLLKNDLCQSSSHVTMGLSQTSRLPERSSL
jgi:hypothetical protein